MYKTIRIKNIHHRRCLKFVSGILKKYNISIILAELDKFEVDYNEDKTDFVALENELIENGFGIILNREQQLVNQIKTLVMDLVYEMNFKDSIVQKSDYISSKLNISYEHLSKIFKKNEGNTLEQFIIGHKLNRVKELINEDELTLSEISYRLDYSSVQYLSTLFKKKFNTTPSEYKKTIIN